MLDSTNENLKEQVELHKVNEALLEKKVVNLHGINELKEEQIKNLEALPRTTVKVSSLKWYHITGIIVGSFSLGYLVKSLAK